MSNRLSAEALDRITDAIEEFSKTALVSSEANTKKKVIERLLEILGWNVYGNDVVLEYTIRIGSTTKYVDYALMLENKPVVLVEAKPFDCTLSDDDSAQIISYGRIEDVQWTVLTNGKSLKIFDTQEGKTEKECLVIEINLAKARLHERNLTIISRESIISGDIEEAMKRLAVTKRAARNLEEKQSQISEAFKTVLLKFTGLEDEKRIDNISKQLARETLRLFTVQGETIRKPISETHTPISETYTPTLYRSELASKPSGEVMLFPAKIEGAEFLKKYNAWGYVRFSRKTPYLALYVGRPKSGVLYFGEVESVTQPFKSKQDAMMRTGIKEKDMKLFSTGKRVVNLKSGTLVEFKDPIRLQDRHSAPRGLRYTTLKKIIEAKRVEDL